MRKHNSAAFAGNRLTGKKRILLIVLSVLTALFLLAATGCLAVKGVARSKAYDSYLQSAASESDQDTAKSRYLRAIALCPTKLQAYSDLLSFYLGSGEKDGGQTLSKSEYKVISSLISDNEDMLLRVDAAAYADEVLYPLANALFFSCEGNEKKTAAEFLDKVAEYTADESRREFVKALRSAAECYEAINGGEPENTNYRDYFDSLAVLCETELVKKGTTEEALSVGRFIIGELERGVFAGSDISEKSQQTLYKTAESLIANADAESADASSPFKDYKSRQGGASAEKGKTEGVVNNWERLFHVLQISSILLFTAAGLCFICTVVMFFLTRQSKGASPHFSAPGTAEMPIGHGAADFPPVNGNSTEVLSDRGAYPYPDGDGRGADAYPAAYPHGQNAGANRRNNARFEIVKENMLIHSDEEIPRN